MMLMQSVRWIVMPLPRVTNPTISSPGIGLQHLEKRTATSWIPRTMMPPLCSFSGPDAPSPLAVLQHILIGHVELFVLLVQLVQLVEDLALLQTAVTDGGKHGIPVLEAVLVHDLFGIFRFGQLADVLALGMGVGGKHLPSFQDIIFLALLTEPAVDPVLGLGALDDLQPVPAGSLGILGGDDLDPVAVVDLCLDGHQLSVDAGTDHPVSDGGMDGIGKVDGTGTRGKGLHISGRREDIDVLVEEVEIALQKAHELPVVRHVLLPLQDLAEPVQLLLFLLRTRRLAVGGLFVFPVGCDTVLGDAVHLEGPDLDLKGFALGPISVVCSDWYIFGFGMAM